jgi:acyl-CoA synthetase (NDP forming)
VDLGRFFQPRSIALIGASGDPLSISARPLRMLGQHGFGGRLYPVNPKYTELLGRRAYPSIGAVPDKVDLALVAVPAPLVAGALEECAAAGVAHALVLSSGFAEAGADGQRLQDSLAEIASRTALRICGPNSEGFFAPGVCATFSPVVDLECGYAPSPAGPIAVVAQSGGVGFGILNRGREQGMGFHTVISTGNEVDLEWLDYVEYLLDQPSVRVVLGFLEGLRRPERLSQVAAKAAELRKPLILVKIGRSDAGARAAAAHTGSLVGSDDEYAAAFRDLGILRVDDVDEMLDLAAYFCVGRLPAGRRVAVLTTSGGAGAWLADACAMQGLEVPAPEPEVCQEIAAFIPSYGSVRNPIDITAQGVFSGGFERALDLLTRSPRFDAVLCVGSLIREEATLKSLPDVARAIQGSRAPVAYYSYTRPSPAVVAGLAELGIPCYPTPHRAARALASAAEYRAFIELHEGAPA